MSPEDREQIRAARALKQEYARAAKLVAPKPKRAILVPTNSSAGMPPKEKGNLVKEFPKEPKLFDSLAPAPKPTYLLHEHFAKIASEEIEKVSSTTFRALCATAIADGAISLQDFFKKFGRDVIPRNVDVSLEEWPLPSPKKIHSILEFFSTLNPDQFTGNKLPWRHRQYAPPAATPAPQG